MPCLHRIFLYIFIRFLIERWPHNGQFGQFWQFYAAAKIINILDYRSTIKNRQKLQHLILFIDFSEYLMIITRSLINNKPYKDFV